MSSRSFRSVFMVASCAGAALGCYLVSLRVASERAQLEDVETKIVLAQRDMRVLQTEIGTRGRLSQLERWNAGAFALSAPAADQFVKGGFELARLAAPERKPDFKAPVVLASAPLPEKKVPLGESATDDGGASAVARPSSGLLHEASLKIETRELPARTVAHLPRAAAKSVDEPATAAKPAHQKSAEKPALAAAHVPKTKMKKKLLSAALHVAAPAADKSVDKKRIVTGKALTRRTEVAKVDPLAPLPGHHSLHSKGIAAER